MNITIRYTNSDFQPITLQQAMILKIYNKESYEGGKLKTVENYGFKDRSRTDVILKGGEYYLNKNENLQTIVACLANTAKYWNFSIMNKQIVRMKRIMM